MAEFYFIPTEVAAAVADLPVAALYATLGETGLMALGE